MAAELVGAFINEMQKETTLGYEPGLGISPLPVGNGRGYSFPRNANQGFTAFLKIPGNATLTTGVKVDLLVTDDGSDPSDLGKAAVFGVSVKKITSGTSTADPTASAGTEQKATVTLNGTSGVFVVGTVTIAAANLNSAAAGDWIAVRIRRIATDAADLLTGRVLVAGIAAYAY
jgi:hypothetical protein